MSNQSECTCHPDDRPPACQHRYAASECIAAYNRYLEIARSMPQIETWELDVKSVPKRGNDG